MPSSLPFDDSLKPDLYMDEDLQAAKNIPNYVGDISPAQKMACNDEINAFSKLMDFNS